MKTRAKHETVGSVSGLATGKRNLCRAGLKAQGNVLDSTTTFMCKLCPELSQLKNA